VHRLRDLASGCARIPPQIALESLALLASRAGEILGAMVRSTPRCRERQLEHLLDDRSIDSSGFPCGSDGTVSVAVRSVCLPLAGDRPTPTLRAGFPLSPMDPETGAAGAFARDRAARALDGGHCANGTHQDTPAWLADLPV